MLQRLRRGVLNSTKTLYIKSRRVLCFWLGDHSSIGAEVWIRLACGKELQWLDLVLFVLVWNIVSEFLNEKLLIISIAIPHCFYAIQKVKKSKSFEMSLNNYINLLLICLLKKEGIFISWHLAYFKCCLTSRTY